jgi:hypothetical protein
MRVNFAAYAWFPTELELRPICSAGAGARRAANGPARGEAPGGAWFRRLILLQRPHKVSV